MAAWPGTLPQNANIKGYLEPLGNTLIRSDTEFGPAKQRRRYTAAVHKFELTQVLSSDEVDDLITFYETTLQGGVDSFTWVHPRTKAAATIRFTQPPTIVPRDTLYDASYSVEILP